MGRGVFGASGREALFQHLRRRPGRQPVGPPGRHAPQPALLRPHRNSNYLNSRVGVLTTACRWSIFPEQDPPPEANPPAPLPETPGKNISGAAPCRAAGFVTFTFTRFLRPSFSCVPPVATWPRNLSLLRCGPFFFPSRWWTTWTTWAKVHDDGAAHMQALALPTRLYDLLPIGLLIGAILALAGLAQRNELVILRCPASAACACCACWDRHHSADDRRGCCPNTSRPGPR